MSEKSQETKVETAAVETNAASKSGEAAKSSGTLSRVIGFLLLVVAIIAGGLAANGQLMPLIDSLRATIGSQQEVEDSTSPVIEPVVREMKPVEPLVQSEPAAAPAQEAIAASEESRELLATIEQLREELKGMEASQRSLRRGLLEQQRMNLQVRLRWITDPASRAPQIQLAWEEISLLPGLSGEERQRAEAMHALARGSVQQIDAWQASLQKWADALSTPVHQNVMPKPEHPWLAWIVGQFHLRQAPTEEARRLSGLRERLLSVSRALTLEQWPADGAWQSLHAELLLQAKAMQEEADGAVIDLGLPEDFSAIRKDMKTLRDAARQWSERAKGGF